MTTEPIAGWERECPRCHGSGRCHGPECQGGLVLTDTGKQIQTFIERCIERYREQYPQRFGVADE